jgi:hypothetical protein
MIIWNKRASYPADPVLRATSNGTAPKVVHAAPATTLHPIITNDIQVGGEVLKSAFSALSTRLAPADVPKTIPASYSPIPKPDMSWHGRSTDTCPR